MRKTGAVIGVVVLVIAAIAVVTTHTSHKGTTNQGPTTGVAKVEKGSLSDSVSLAGTLTYQARPDGSPYSVINQMPGTYTALPSAGDSVGCGNVLYRVDDEPVILLCGTTPSYRSLSVGLSGPDVAELNANLVKLGYATKADIEPSSDDFTYATEAALEKLQSKVGETPTGELDLGQAVVLADAARVSKVTAALGGMAEPGAQLAQATSGTLEVQVALDPSQQSEVTKGESAQITLPDNTAVAGKVDRIGRVAVTSAGSDGSPGAVSIPAYISLNNPSKTGALDQAPVQVDITTKGVSDALSVPVTALVGNAGGGFAVEIIRPDGTHELVSVTVGLYDATGGRVQIEGDVTEGQSVAVPSS